MTANSIHKLSLHGEHVHFVHAAHDDSIVPIHCNAAGARELAVHVPVSTKGVEQLVIAAVDVDMVTHVACHDDLSVATGGNVSGILDTLNGLDGCRGHWTNGNDSSYTWGEVHEGSVAVTIEKSILTHA